ncbi:MAG TPA: L,D-transpeptidase family protein [Longimicrobiaceae bacterium]|nr:L,D-transpeptidase family protein [Longimicrobiaceae bacterium]
MMCVEKLLRANRLAVLLAAALAMGSASGCAAVGPWRSSSTPASPPTQVPEIEHAQKTLERNHGNYVVIDLDVNELRFMDGERVLWSAKVGTGTGLRLRGEGTEWEFSTPNGVFFVQYKEENPVWILPDWYFVKNKRPIPPQESDQRRMPGALGDAAVYLSDEIAIHGTDKPELLGQRVSHGCIRLSNEHAKRLFHNVQIGTPVLIVGGEDLAPPDSVPIPTNPGAPRNRQPNPLLRMTTAQLFQRLDREIARADTSFAWTQTASVLITRGISDDSLALRGILQRAGRTQNAAFEREYATFLADAFTRGSLRAIVSLARIDAASRQRAAGAIVEATMDSYHGALDEPGAPWPTRRVPPWRLGPDGTRGWKALAVAEEAYRTTRGTSRIVLRTGGE